MIKVRIGEGWSSEPALRRALQNARGARARLSAARTIVDVIAIEVDGVDIAAGRTEGPVLDTAAALVRAVDRLSAGRSHASVTFEEGAVELVLRRRGPSALLSLVTLSRPARVLAHEVDVDLESLALAARRAAIDWCDSVAAIAPAVATAPAIAALRRAASRPTRLSPAAVARPVAPAGPPRPRRRDPPACSFELHDEEGQLASWRGPGADLASLLVPGRVTLRAPDGREIVSVAGPPFLAFRELCAAASRMAAAGSHGSVSFQLARPGRRRPATVEVDARTGALSVDGRSAGTCEPLSLARAFLEGAADFCAIVEARSSAQSENAHLADLRDATASALAHVRELEAGDFTPSRGRRLRMGRPRRPPAEPIAPGRLRRVSFRKVRVADVGVPATPSLFLAGRALVACGRQATIGIDASDASVRWRAPGAERAALCDRALVLATENGLRCLEAEDGRARWSRPLPAGCRLPQAVVAAAGGQVAVLSGGRASAVEIGTGRPGWSFESPGALRLGAARFGSLLVLAADTGLVHGLDPSGRVAWRLRGPGPLAAAPVLGASSCLLLFQTELGALLAAVDAATGRRRVEAPLDLAPSGPPAAFAGRIAVPGTVGGDPLVTALEFGGAVAWTSAPSLGAGPLALAPARSTLIVKTADGSCAALGRDGTLRWSRNRETGAAAVGNLPPVVARGLAFVPSEEVEVLDIESGERLGRLPVQAPASLLVNEELSSWALDGEGLLTASRLRGHLSVLA